MSRTAPLTSKRCILYIFIQQIYVLNILNILYTLRFFFSSKCCLFHNANFFGSCIIHILYRGCAEIKKNNNSGAKGLISPWMQFCFFRVVSRTVTLSKYPPPPFMIWFCSAFWSQDLNMHLVFPAFASGAATSLVTNKSFCVFLFNMSICSQWIYHQHLPEADVSHLLSHPPGLFGPS